MRTTKIDMETNRLRPRRAISMGMYVLMLSMFVAVGRAQTGNPVVEAHAITATDAVHAGSPVKLALVAEVAAGYHINDHKPSLDYLIATKVVIEPSDKFTVKDVIYPRGTAVKFAFSDVPLSVYQGKIAVGVLLQSANALAPGTYTLKAKFAYQACSDHSCLPPTGVSVAITLNVVPNNVPLKAVEPDVFKRIHFE